VNSKLGPPSAGATGAYSPAGSVCFYRLIRFLSWTYLRLFHRLRVHGQKNAPSEGGLLVVANHASYLDIPAVAASFRRHVSFVARGTLTSSRLIAWVIRVCGGILVGPGESDRAALRAIGKRLDAGYAVAIFPEGTRTSDGRLGEFRGGALFAVKRSKVPLVPVGIRGSYASFSRHHKLPRPHTIRIAFGKPLAPGAPQATEHIREAIQQSLATLEGIR